MQVSNGAVLTYTGTWPHTEHFGFGTTDEVVSDVGAKLSAYGLVIRNYSTSGNLAAVTGGAFDVSIQVQVENGLGYGDISDVQKIINDSVYAVLGDTVSASSIPNVQGQSTGQPAGGGSQTSSASNSIADWFSSLTTKGLSTLGLVFIGLIAGVILIVTAEHKV